MTTPSMDSPVRLARAYFDAAIFDLDGVLTRTARVHARAWKETFDAYLRQRCGADRTAFVPFDAVSDYNTFVDGRPREDGVETFLSSRGLHLPRGTPADGAAQDTVWGLANAKRNRFLRELDTHGVEVSEGAPALLDRLAGAGLGLAVVSSSRNCRAILARAGLVDRFDVVLDGADRARLGLSPKPAPDTFVEAAHRLQVDPRRTMLFEDAVVGIEAARAGGFGCVVAVDRSGHPDALVRAGAHLTVRALGQIVVTDQVDALRPTVSLPSALERFEDVRNELAGRAPMVFLDYDGTLTPIVARPEDATLSDEARRVVRVLGCDTSVAIVSGRDLRDVRQLVGVAGLHYAGSHGFEIERPDGTRIDTGPGDAFTPQLDHAERDLRAVLHGIDGVQLERKRFTIAIHHRNVADKDVSRVSAAVDAVADAHQGLRCTTGKKVIELQPRVDWHKGRAVGLLRRVLSAPPDDPAALYVGDDVTDEDAFLAVTPHGVPIVVTEESRLTYARYTLRHPVEVLSFLERLHTSLCGGGRS